MNAQPGRSELVVDAYKKHKLAISAIKRIRQMIAGFERRARLDTQIGRIGLVILLLLMAALSFYIFGSSEVVTLQ